MQPNVHDAFFKEMLSRPEHAASLLQQILPARITARIHFDSLAPCAGSYVDEALKERHSDLLFSVTIEGRPALIYILFEHQSTVDGLMSFRLLRYEVRIWERWLRDNPNARKLPVILPVVLHHSVTGWSGSTAFEDLLDVDEATLADVAPYIPNFQFLLEDISHETDEALVPVRSPRWRACRCGACGMRASRGSWSTASAPGQTWCAKSGAPPTEWLRWCGSCGTFSRPTSRTGPRSWCSGCLRPLEKRARRRS